MRTSSASDVALILRMTWPRWTFTVTSLKLNSAAICLFSRPMTHGHGNVAVSGDENDWKMDVQSDQFMLKIQSALAG